MAFPKIICLKQMIILGVDLIDVGQAGEEQEGERDRLSVFFKFVCVCCVKVRERKLRVRRVKTIILCQLDSK